MADNGMYYTYFLISEVNNKCYVGSTSKDPKLRLLEHNNGSNKWTNENKPFKLIYYESYECKTDAIRRELFYKSGVGRRIMRAIVNEMTK